MTNKLSLWVAVFLSFVLFGAFGTTTYFLVVQSKGIETLKSQKADLNKVYDRAAFEEKIKVKTGPVGPKGPRGDSGEPGVFRTVSAVFMYKEIADLKVGSAVRLYFTRRFNDDVAFRGTELIGALVTSLPNSKEFFGNIHFHEGYSLWGSYKVIATSVPSTGVTKWKFVKLEMDELKIFYTRTKTDADLATKAFWKDIYDRKTFSALIVKKIWAENTYSKTALDEKIAKKIADNPRDQITYTTAKLDEKVNLKRDKTATYLKTDLDHSVSVKADTGFARLKTHIDRELISRVDTTFTNTKAEIDKLKNDFLVNWTRYKKTFANNNEVKTKITGDINWGFNGVIHSRYMHPSFGSSGYLDVARSKRLYKGDQITIKGTITKSASEQLGVLIGLKNNQEVSAWSPYAKIREYKVWTRSFQPTSGTGTVKSDSYTKTFRSYDERTVDKHVLVQSIEQTTHYDFEIDLYFHNDYIYSYGTSYTDGRERIVFALIDYPDHYGNRGMFIESVQNVKFTDKNGKIPDKNPTVSFPIGTEITFIRDWGNQEFRSKIWSATKTY